jgi:acyl transferase domain-containing protein
MCLSTHLGIVFVSEITYGYGLAKICLVSTVTSEVILPAAVRQPLCEAQHWLDQLSLPVRFSVALELGLRSLTHGSVVVEVGPNPVLIGMSKVWIERLK